MTADLTVHFDNLDIGEIAAPEQVAQAGRQAIVLMVLGVQAASREIEGVGSRERGVAAMATASQSVYAETYSYLKTHPGATLAQLAADMGLKLPTAVKRLQRMQERGRVRADGTRRADMRWYVGAA